MNLNIEAESIKEETEFNWTSEDGIPSSINLLVKEFIEEHSLKVITFYISFFLILI